MRHKLPYQNDTTKQGADLSDGVTSKQTMRDTTHHHNEKSRLEREVPESCRDACEGVFGYDDYY
tara:strand:- start:5924 stop:6115 length:192 start_codon:yes stop_codon:yes gene_type:complete